MSKYYYVEKKRAIENAIQNDPNLPKHKKLLLLAGLGQLYINICDFSYYTENDILFGKNNPEYVLTKEEKQGLFEYTWECISAIDIIAKEYGIGGIIDNMEKKPWNAYKISKEFVKEGNQGVVDFINDYKKEMREECVG